MNIYFLKTAVEFVYLRLKGSDKLLTHGFDGGLYSGPHLIDCRFKRQLLDGQFLIVCSLHDPQLTVHKLVVSHQPLDQLYLGLDVQLSLVIWVGIATYFVGAFLQVLLSPYIRLMQYSSSVRPHIAHRIALSSREWIVHSGGTTQLPPSMLMARFIFGPWVGRYFWASPRMTWTL